MNAPRTPENLLAITGILPSLIRGKQSSHQWTSS
jgi:hypothetical protein